jgi:hypothetical protein
MASLKVNVAPDGERWKVHHNFYSKWYPTKDAALQAAMHMAENAAGLGNEVEVLLTEGEGEVQVALVSRRAG